MENALHHIHPDSPAGDLGNFLSSAETGLEDVFKHLGFAKPRGFSCGSSGIGSTQHLACEAFARATGTEIVHVPYKGSSQALADLVGGQIQLSFDTTSSAMGFIRSGKVKALAVMTPRRATELPDVPTLAEAGVPGVTSAVVQQLVNAQMSAGEGEEDYSGIAKAIFRMANL